MTGPLEGSYLGRLRRWTVLPLLIASCGAPAEVRFPELAELSASAEAPDPLVTFFDPRPIEDTAGWEQIRRPELQRLFEHYVYGLAPEAPPVSVVLEEPELLLFEGRVRYRGLRIELPPAPPIHLALFLPPGPEPAPVFLALNPCGNHTLLADERIRASDAWVSVSCPRGRGGRAERWPIEAIIGRGYALATFHESDVDPDDPSDERFADGIHPHLRPAADFRTQWGTLAAWAFGLQRAVDALLEEPAVRGDRIIVTGHSRRGKSALLAAAFDPRIAMAIPHQSGTGGATMTRGTTGESVGFINETFPNWFNNLFPEFAGNEDKLPIDQHLLIALVAPRPLLVTNGAGDTHADPMGALRAVEHAEIVYRLYGAGIARDSSAAPTLDGHLAWHQREGGHSVGAADWEVFMDFADRHR
jgi:hypothetical protein